MSNTRILPIIKLVNERLEDLRDEAKPGTRAMAAFSALSHAREFLYIAREELQRDDLEKLG